MDPQPSKLEVAHSNDRRILRATAILSVVLGALKVGLVQAKYEALGNFVDLALVLLAPLCYGGLYFRLVVAKISQSVTSVGKSVMGWRTRSWCHHDVEQGLESECSGPAMVAMSYPKSSEVQSGEVDICSKSLETLVEDSASFAQCQMVLPDLDQPIASACSPVIATGNPPPQASLPIHIDAEETSITPLKISRSLPAPPCGSSIISCYSQMEEARSMSTPTSRSSIPASEMEACASLNPGVDPTATPCAAVPPPYHNDATGDLAEKKATTMKAIEEKEDQMPEASSISSLSSLNASTENLPTSINPPNYYDVASTTDIEPPAYCNFNINSRSAIEIGKGNSLAHSVSPQDNAFTTFWDETPANRNGKEKAMMSAQLQYVPGFHLPFRMMDLGKDITQDSASDGVSIAA